MMKKDLRLATGITTTALAKMGRNENVSTEILVKICEILNCRLEDICEAVPVSVEGENE
jgi:DNA-binding Xre family transcriptional regulator